MKKIMTILAIILFAFTSIGGSVFYLADIPAAVQEDQNKDNFDEDGDTETGGTASGYWSSYYASSFDGGTGESDAPYLISTAAQLARMAYLINGSSSSSYNKKYYELTADIDLSAHYWVPIANTSSLEFRGSFFGGYHVIKNMTCYMSSATDSYYSVGCALFGNAKQDAYISCFALTGINITTTSVAFDSSKYYKFSGVAAQLSCDSGSCSISYINIFGTITCSFTGTPYELLMGGAVGYAQNASMLCIQSYVTIKDSGSNSSSSSNAAYCGGIVGWAATNCTIYATAMLGYIDFYGLGTNSGGGGLVGQLSGGAKISESYAVYGSNPGGSFWLSRYAGGGLVGKVNNGKIISSWSYLGIYLNSSSISTKYKGGLVGYASSLTIYCAAVYNSTSIGYTYSVGNNSYSGSGASWLSSASFRRSSTFNSYMQNDSYSESQKWWYGSPWNFDSDSYNHLNYGFPVIQSLCAEAYVNSNKYVDTCGVKTTGTGVDTSYTSGGNDGTQSYGLKFLIGGDLYVTSKGKSTCYFRYLSRYTNNAVKIASGAGTSTSYSASIAQCAGKYSSLHGYTSNIIYFYVFYSAPTASYWQNNYASSFAGGSGTSDSPYLISNGAQLARLAYLSNSSSDYSTYNSLYYKLIDDIDISGKIWTPIALLYNFTGNFDGGGYTIKGLWCQLFGDSDPTYTKSSSAVSSMGLFGGVGAGATVSNFVLVDVDLGGDGVYQNMVVQTNYSFRVGAVAGNAYSTDSSLTTTISQVGVFGSININFWSGLGYVGGLVGFINGKVVLEKSFNYASVENDNEIGNTSSGYTGGLVGELYGSAGCYPTIDNCYNAGYVYGAGADTGGIVGYAYTYSSVYIQRCYNIGNVSGFYNVGGILGRNAGGTNGKINNCFSDASVRNDSKYVNSKYVSYTRAGALVGYNVGTVNYCGYNSEKSSTSIYYNSNSSGVTNITSFTSTSTPPNKNYVTSFYSSGTYTWNYATYLTTSASYIWCKPYSNPADRYLNDCYPVLTWSLRQRYVGTNFSQCGTTTMAAVGDGATAGESQANSRYLILGMKIKIFTTPTSGAYGDYTGIYETKASNTSTKVKISDEPTYYEFTPGDTFDNIRVAFNGNQNDSWISFNIDSNFTAGTTYRVYFVDNNTYGTSGASYSLKNICFKRLSYGNWYTMSLPEIKETGQGSIVNKTSDSVDWQANAISGNTYSNLKVQLYKGDTYVSSLSSAKKEYSTVSVKAQKSYEFTYNSSTANRLRIGMNGNQYDACFVISASQTSMASGGTYRIIFVDNTTTYGTAGKGGSFSNIRLQYKYGSNWEDREIPDALSTDNCTVTRVDRFTLKFSGSAISGNTYSNSKVQFWKDDTYVSEVSAKTISATTQYYWTTFVRGNVSNGSSNYAYYAIYTSWPVTINVRVAAYTPYDNAVNYPTSTSTVGAFKYTRYTSGFPLTTTTLTSSNMYSTSFLSYVYRSITLSATTASSAWKFKGWYSSTSTTISASTCAGTPTYSSSSYSFTPASNSTRYYIAVFVPDQRTVTFGGVYTSEDDGATYTRKITSSSYPMATLKYVKPTYSAIVGSTQTSQNSTTSSATTITYTYSKTWSLSINSNSNYTFVGWYYGTDGNTLLSSSTTYSSSGAMYDNLRAKFKRKVVNYDIYIMTDEGTGTYKNSASGGNPTLDYYNRTNNYTYATLTATNHFEIQAGTNISIGYSNDYYAKPGYKFMGVNANTMVPTYQSNYPLNIRNITASNSTNNKLYFFYKKTTANMLKHAVKNFAKISNVSVTNPSGSSFVKNSNDFYESQNFGVNNSYALAKVSFTLANSADVTFEYISAGEMTCDYGIFSDIDTTLTSSNSIDTTNVKLSTYGGFNDGTLRQVVYKNVSAGSHYIYIKYRKDSSIHTKYDSLQFRLVTEYSNSSYWYFEDGEYPQSYVGSSMNNTLTNNASFVGYLDYNNGKADITSSSSSSENIIKIYSYSGKKYAAMKAPKTQTLTMNDGNTYTFSSGNLYFFAFEPIRWEVEQTKMPNINAFETDGTAYRTLPSSLKYEDALTVNLWAYMDDWSEYQAQDMVMLSTGEKGFKIDTSSSGGYIRYNVYDDGVGYKYAEMLGKTWAALASGWHMFTFTFDGSTINGYVDGSMQGPNSSTFTSGKIGYDSNSQIYVGKEYGTTRSFVGKIDYENIDIINRALSSSEISNAYIQSNVYQCEEIWSFGDYKNCFDAVSHNVLGFGAVASDLTSIQEGWKFENSNMYKNVSKNPNSSNAIANETFKYKQTDSSVLYTKTLNWSSTPNSGDIYDYIDVDNITEGEQYVLNVTLESGTITASGYPAIVLDIVKSDNSGLTVRNNAEIYFKTGVTSYSATLTVKEQTVEEGSHLKVWFWKDSTYVITPENAVVKIEIRRIPAHDYQYFTPSSGQEKIESYALLEENVRVASMKELEENLNDLRANASDMVAVFMGVSADKYCEYWTRDLGLYLKNGYTITSTGQKKSAWLNRVSGTRFSITFAEGSLNF